MRGLLVGNRLSVVQTRTGDEEASMKRQRDIGEDRRPPTGEVVVIGGGQAGLSVSYQLAKRDLPFVILDANERIGDSWRKRWDSLKLFTPARYDGLPG
jgi:NADPH-dependent 2,4-dienoyl-CoA reductase/sulfur reductase-like enzyme